MPCAPPPATPPRYATPPTPALRLVDGDTLNMGAVGALRGVRSAIYVASLVLRHTAHSLLVGSQATDFARKFGNQSTGDISTEDSLRSHSDWLARDCSRNFWRNLTGTTEGCGRVQEEPHAQWGAATSPELTAADPGPGPAWAYGAAEEAEGSEWAAAAEQGDAPYPPAGRRRLAEAGSEDNHDTIPMVAVDSTGAIAAATTTNGLSHKIPGRVGDSPVPGAGNYAVTGIGGCGATGDGDIMMRFLPVSPATLCPISHAVH